MVEKRHSVENIGKLLEVFPYITSWNPDISGRRIFLFRPPVFRSHNVKKGDEFINRKFIVNISGNKHSDNPKELYSERLEFIKYCEENNIEFTLYGNGWDNMERPSYKGSVREKLAIYGKYKYALCLENAKDLSGYVTEKIIDCFMGNIVPIYAGAKDIEKIIPKNLYIDYFSFNNKEELIEYLENIPEIEWKRMLKRTKDFIEDGGLFLFTAQSFVENFINIFSDKPYIKLSENKLYRRVFILNRLKKIKDSFKLENISWITKIYRKILGVKG